jgi:hypothetical protein
VRAASLPTSPSSKTRGPQLADAGLHGQLAERFRELTALTVLLAEQEKASARQQETTEWLTRLAVALVARPRWWAIMPASWQTSRMHTLLKRRGLFDVDAYLRLNPDVAAGDIEPLMHYLLHGLGEGRPRSF